jgi:hypothetical protein
MKRFVPKRLARQQDQPSILRGGIDGSVLVFWVCSMISNSTRRSASLFETFIFKERWKVWQAGAKHWRFIEV